MSEECILNTKTKSKVELEYFCSNLLEDFNGDGKAAYEEMDKVTWEEIPEIIVGDPDENPAIAEMYHLVAEECQKLFQLKLLGTY